MQTAPGFPGGGRLEGREAIVRFSQDFEAAWESVRYEITSPRIVHGAVVHGARWVVTGKESQIPVTLDFFAVARMDADRCAAARFFWNEDEALEYAAKDLS